MPPWQISKGVWQTVRAESCQPPPPLDPLDSAWVTVILSQLNGFWLYYKFKTLKYCKYYELLMKLYASDHHQWRFASCHIVSGGKR